MHAKKLNRIRRMKRTRLKITELGAIRMSVHKTSQHIYAQIIDTKTAHVLAQASSVDPTIRQASNEDSKKADKVGRLIAERAKEKGITKIAFDRSGYPYHGNIKLLADAARANGLEF